VHIAFLTNYYLPVVNGAVRAVSSLREDLMLRGHNVFIFAHNEGGYEDQEPFIFRYPTLPLPFGEVPAVLPISPFMDQLLPRLKLDVIHAHHPILLGQTAARKSYEMGLPLVFTFHTLYWEYTHYIPFRPKPAQEYLKNTVHRWVREFMQNCQHIILPSESVRDILVRNYGLQDGYSVLPTGINLEPFRNADGKSLRAKMGWQDEMIVISVGRLAPEKNWETLLHAFARVKRAHPTARLVLIGDGSLRESLESLASGLGITASVTFTGALPFEEIPRYLKAADVFAFASVTETQGLVTLEAIAAGLPVVAVDGPGTRDVVEHGKQALLAANDPDALARGLDELLTNAELRRRFRNSALKRARFFDIRYLGKQVISVYEQALQDKKANRFVTLKA
jgi:glycosyltransferase involved in cell wall biosynthesis